jgi:hypothetical protein
VVHGTKKSALNHLYLNSKQGNTGPQDCFGSVSSELGWSRPSLFKNARGTELREREIPRDLKEPASDVSLLLTEQELL